MSTISEELSTRLREVLAASGEDDADVRAHKLILELDELSEDPSPADLVALVRQAYEGDRFGVTFAYDYLMTRLSDDDRVSYLELVVTSELDFLNLLRDKLASADPDNEFDEEKVIGLFVEHAPVPALQACQYLLGRHLKAESRLALADAIAGCA